MNQIKKTFFKYGLVIAITLFVAFSVPIAFAVDEENVNPVSGSENANENANPGSGSEVGDEVNVNPVSGSENGNEGGNTTVPPTDTDEGDNDNNDNNNDSTSSSGSRSNNSNNNTGGSAVVVNPVAPANTTTTTPPANNRPNTNASVALNDSAVAVEDITPADELGSSDAEDISNESQTASVFNAFKDFFGNAYVMWFFILLLILAFFLLYRERRNRNS
jgi:hypothetical protein